MNLVDSSAWLEYFADGPNASYFSAAIERTRELLVPAIVLYEVFKRVLQQRSEREALAAISVMQQGEIAELTGPLALRAARLSHAQKLPMADSIILATARASGAVIWTQDADFDGMEKVNFRPHKDGQNKKRR